MTRRLAAGCGFVLLAAAGDSAREQLPRQPFDTTPARLSPTLHPAVPNDSSSVWLVPTDWSRSTTLRSAAMANLARGIKLFGDGKFAEALPLVSAPVLAETRLADYAAYYTARVQLRLERLAEARQMFAAVSRRQPPGYLAEAAIAGEAEVAEAQGDFSAAVDFYDGLSRRGTIAPDAVLLRLAKAADASGDQSRAVRAYLRLYYEFPLTDLGAQAADELERLQGLEPPAPSSERYTLELGRAERLFGAKKYPQARSSFESLAPVAAREDAELIGLRLAECDYYLRRYRSAMDGLSPYLDRASRLAEARFFYLTSTREAGDRDEYVRLARELSAGFPDSSWAEETLNNLATHYILDDNDAQADVVFRELSDKFPNGRYAERAAWKVGWWAYKNGRYDEAVKRLESAAAAFPRSDYRPSYLYWAARSRDRLGDHESASARYALLTTDYLNSYYGRLAARLLIARGDWRVATVKSVAEDPGATTGSSDSGSQVPEPDVPRTAELITTLLALELHTDAINELLYAQRMWGDSPAIQATLGWAYSKTGDFRRGINAMKRAYPQYLASGGEALPPDLLRVLFPLDYWPLIRQHSATRNLDPYLVAALVAQESTFIPDIRSHANAIGLMQLVPTTGRRYARRVGIRRYATGLLETPEVNIRLGTAYFSDLVRRFGGTHYALASYNAGEYRVARWIAERPGLDRDEFIDDIPFPETQNYVKKVLGTADDYRRLYAAAPPATAVSRTAKPTAKAASKPPVAKSTSKSRPKVSKHRPR